MNTKFKFNEAIIGILSFSGGHLSITREGEGAIVDGTVLTPVMRDRCEVRIGPDRTDRQVMEVDSRGLRAMAEALIKAADHMDVGITVPEANACDACWQARRHYDPAKHDGDGVCHAVEVSPDDPWENAPDTMPEATAVARVLDRDAIVWQGSTTGRMSGYAGGPVWKPTHTSSHDGSPVRQVGFEDGGLTLILENENGDVWSDPAKDWTKINDNEDDDAPMGWCFFDPHRNGMGERYAHIQNDACFEWGPDPIEED